MAARVQKKISRGYTRDRAEKCGRAGTEEDFTRIYPRPRGKARPRELQISIVCPRALCYNAYVLRIIKADNIIHQLTNFTAA